MYALFTADMPAPEGIEVANFLFADDQITIAWGDVDEAARTIEDHANAVDGFCKKWKLSLNPSKSELIKIFGLKKRLARWVAGDLEAASVSIGGSRVKEVKV